MEVQHNLNQLISTVEEKEKHLQDCEDAARAAIEELHNAIVEYYNAHKEVTVTLLGVDEFTKVLQEKVLKIKAPGHEHMKKEVVDGLADISAMVSNLTKKLNHFLKQVDQSDE